MPVASCTIDAHCTINPSESPDKVCQAISGIFPDVKVTATDLTARAKFEGLAHLIRIREVMHSRKSQTAYRRRLEENMQNNSTWFCLNKQAAYVGTVALCDEGESPLGEMQISLVSPQIEDIVKWLVTPTKQNSSNFV